jgi:oligosaccharide 4-alpha-D-glucosyltransferase
MPLMRPMSFGEPDGDSTPSISSTCLWGPDLLVAPVVEQGKYEIVRFVGKASAGKLEISLQTEAGKAFNPVARGFALLVHNFTAKPRTVSIASRSVPFKWNAERRLLEVNVPARQRQAATVAITL